MNNTRRIASTVALLAISIWLGGLVAFGLTAPAVNPLASCASTLTGVLRQFHWVTIACAALALVAEVGSVVGGLPFKSVDRTRAGLLLLAAALATFVAMRIGPSMEALYDAGTVLGVGASGTELAQLQSTARLCGQAQVLLLSILVVLHASALSTQASDASPRV